MSSVPGFIGPPPLWQEAPRPVIGLTYARPGTARVTRPGIWIAVGVLSVLIGLVSMGVNAVAFMAAREIYRISVKSAAATAVSAARFTPAGPVTLAPVNVVPYDGDWTGRSGLKAAQRQAVLDGLHDSLKLSEDRREMLVRLLSEAGKEIFPDPVSNSSAARMQIDSTGQLPRQSEYDGATGPDLFVTRLGSVQIGDTEAIFKPSKRLSTGWRVRRRCVTDPYGKRSFSAIDIAEALENGYRETGGKINAKQATTVGEAIAAATPREGFDQDLIVRWPSGQGKVLQFDLMVGFGSGQRQYVMEDGRLLSGYEINAINMTTGKPSQRPAMKNTWPGRDPVWAGAAVVDAALHFGLAVVLVIMGVLALIDRPSAIRQHFTYAAIKLVLAVGSIALLVWVSQPWASPFTTSAPGVGAWVATPAGMRIAVMFFFMLLAQVAYPVGLLILIGCSEGLRQHAAAHGSRTKPISSETWASIRALVTGEAGRTVAKPLSIVAGVLALAQVGLAVNALMEMDFGGLVGSAAGLAVSAGVMIWCSQLRWRSTAGAVGVAVVLGMMLMFPAPAAAGKAELTEADYQGLMLRAKSGDPEVRKGAIEQMCQTPRGTLEAVKLLDYWNYAVKVDAADRIPDTYFQAWYRDKHSEMQQAGPLVVQRVTRLLRDPRRAKGTVPGAALVKAIGVPVVQAEDFLPMLKGDDVPLREFAAEVIAGARGSDDNVRKLLEPLLVDQSPRIRQTAQRRLDALYDRAGAGGAGAGSVGSSGAVSVGSSGAGSVGSSGAGRDLLGSDSPHLRAEGIRQVTRDAGFAANPEIERLVLAAARGKDWEPRHVAMDAMARCGAKYVPALVELATSDDASIRADAVGRLDRMNDGAVTEKMLQIFAENQELRGGAQMFLKGRMRNGALTPAMLVPLLSSGDPDLRKMAAEMLNEGNRRYALGLATQRRINEILKPYSTSLGGQAVAWTVPASVAGDEDASAGSGGSDVFGFLKDLVTWATGALAALVTLVGLVWLLSERPMGRQPLVTEPAG